jgi:hypothetical protein
MTRVGSVTEFNSNLFWNADDSVQDISAIQGRTVTMDGLSAGGAGTRGTEASVNELDFGKNLGPCESGRLTALYRPRGLTLILPVAVAPPKHLMKSRRLTSVSGTTTTNAIEKIPPLSTEAGHYRGMGTVVGVRGAISFSAEAGM